MNGGGGEKAIDVGDSDKQELSIGGRNRRRRRRNRGWPETL